MRDEGRLYQVNRAETEFQTSIRRIRYSPVSTFTARLICRLHSGVKVKVKVEGKRKSKEKEKEKG